MNGKHVSGSKAYPVEIQLFHTIYNTTADAKHARMSLEITCQIHKNCVKNKDSLSSKMKSENFRLT